MVARAEGAGPSLLAGEAAGALAGFSSDPVALVTACRRLVDRHPEVGPVWWLCARLLAGADPAVEAHRAAAELDGDDTAAVLAAELPGQAAVTVVGWPEQAAQALRRRGDVEVFAVDFDGEGAALARRLGSAGTDAWDVPPSGLAAATVNSSLVLLEAVSAGPDGILAAPGSRAAAAVARHAGVAVWVASGVGRCLPARLWQAQLERLDASPDEPWERRWEVVPLDLVDTWVGPGGPRPGADLPRSADCPVAAELLRPAG